MTCGGMLAARAEDWKATGEYDWHDVGGRVYELEKGHTYWVGEVAGKFFSNKGKGSLLDQADVKQQKKDQTRWLLRLHRYRW